MYNSTPLHNISPPGNFGSYSLDGSPGGSCGTSFYHRKPFSSSLGRENFLESPSRSNSRLSRKYSLSDLNTKTIHKKYKDFENKSGATRTADCSLTSTYIDMRSPGYSERVVRYNEQHGSLMPTHQQQYNSPGVLPIVHFNKKDLPVLKQKPNLVTVRMASSDLWKHNVPEHNRMLLEKIVHSSIENIGASPRNAEGSTRSVLDALKEISRKRIRASEECEFEDDGKKVRLNYDSGVEMRKRLRSETQTEESAISTDRCHKKVCSIDELMASQTSTMINTGLSASSTKKRTMEKAANEEPKEIKRPNLVDVETQTVAVQVKTTATDPGPDIEKKETEEKLASSTAKKNAQATSTSIKIFDERPLEAMRKNRLSILMGSFASEKDAPRNRNEKKEEDVTVTSVSEEQKQNKSPEKPLVSILSSPNKNMHKNKHVTFNIPNTAAVDISPLSVGSFEPLASPNKPNCVVTQTSMAIATPLCSSFVERPAPDERAEAAPSVSQPASDLGFSTKIVQMTGNHRESLNRSVPNVSEAISLNPIISSNASSTVITSPITEPKSNAAVANVAPNGRGVSSSPVKFSFGDSSLNAVTTAAAFTQKLGGFKFNLNAGPVFSENKAAAGSAEPERPNKNDRPMMSLPSPQLGGSPGNGSISTYSKPFAGVSNPIPSQASTTSTGSTNNVFGVPSQAPVSSSTSGGANSFGVNVANPFMSTVSSSLVNVANAANAGFAAFNKAPGQTSQPSMFTSSANNKTSVVTNPGFDTASVTVKPVAVTSTSTSIFSFPANTTSTTNFNFHQPAKPFGEPSGVSPFAKFSSNSTLNPAFKLSNSPVAPQLVTPAAAATSAPNFISNASSVFGGRNTLTPSFGKPMSDTAISGFNNAIVTSASSSFNNAPAPVPNAFSPFASTAANAAKFSGGTNLEFGGTTSTPTFPANPSSVNASAINFGKTAGFSAANVFEVPKTSTAFGAANAQSFGKDVGSVNSSAFGNVGTTSSPFTSKSGFGSNPAAGFGSFGANFGGPSGPEKPPENNGFGSPPATSFHNPNSFGSNFLPNPAVAQSGVYSFGSDSKPAVFSFGSNEQPKPAFSFVPDNSGGASFVAGSSNFGSASSGFGSATALQLNNQAGMFNIGSGASVPGRARAQLKPKRRT